MRFQASTRNFLHPLFYWVLIALLGSGVAVQAQSASVDASFEPPVISSGQAGSYTVTFENVEDIPTIPPPRVDGLVFGDSPSVSRRQSWINGIRSQELSLSWRFAAQREGTISVPARSVQVNGETLTIPSTSVRVVPMSEREKGLFMLEWDLPEKTLYVGEALAANLQVYVREGLEARIPALPEKHGDGFIHTPFTDDVTQSRETVDGIPYRVYSWAVVLTPIRAGELSLETTLTVVYGDPYSTRFGTDSFGFRRVREQQRRLSTGELTFSVQEPPTEGQPQAFNGAIGNFEVEAEMGRQALQAGEPVTLTMRLSGTGNFDRVSAPPLSDSDHWRVYPPKVRFSADGELGLSGTKTFEYLIIPTSAETVETPRIPFAAFNPHAENYEDLSVEPRPVAVSPAPAPASDPTVYARRDTSPSEEETATPWRPNRADIGSVKEAIRPLFVTPVFWTSQGAIALAFLAIFGWQKRQHRLVHDESYARRVVGSRSVRHWTRQATEAAQRKDSEAFYSAAQRALQESVGRYFPRGRQPESLTLGEIEETLRRHNVSETCQESVAHLFQTGDALKYARSSFGSGELQADLDRLIATLRELHKELA